MEDYNRCMCNKFNTALQCIHDIQLNIENKMKIMQLSLHQYYVKDARIIQNYHSLEKSFFGWK